MSTITLDGRVAIVTGAGGGLGRSHALALAARGANRVELAQGEARMRLRLRRGGTAQERHCACAGVDPACAAHV